MTCSDVAEVASELALDLLTGDERAATLAHLETCPSCRHEITRLTETAEEILLLAPENQPSAGFEQRVVARVEGLAASDAIPRSPRRARTPRRWARPVRRVLATAAAIAVLTGGIFLATTRDDETAVALAAEMRTAAGQVVGDATLTSDPPSVVVTIPEWLGLVRSYGATVDATYWLAIEADDGRRELEALPRADEEEWKVAIDTEAKAVATISILDNNGNQWCSARFSDASKRRTT
jgi:hypothetical protein